MVILRCPFCGEKITKDMRFCSHCGKQIDKPHIDDVDTAFQDVGSIMLKIVGFVILWFIVGLLVGFISNVLDLFPMYSPMLLVLTTVFTVLIVCFIKMR